VDAELPPTNYRLHESIKLFYSTHPSHIGVSGMG